MAQTFSQLVERYHDAGFRDQCLWSVLFLIRYIDNENEATPNHTARVLWSKVAMANPSAMADVMSAMTITDASCTGDTPPTDAQVQAALETLVNRYTE